DELGRFFRGRIEREGAAGRTQRFAGRLRRGEARTCDVELGAREHLAQRDVAIAVEVPLDGFAELARGRKSRRAIELGRTHADRVELGRDGELRGARGRPRIDAAERRSELVAIARVERLE